MNASSIVSWWVGRLAEAPWGFGLVGRWTALLILAWRGCTWCSRPGTRAGGCSSGGRPWSVSRRS